MNSVREQVLHAVDEAWPQQLNHLQALVRERSVLGHEAGVQRLMHATFRDMGLQVTSFEPDLGTISRLPGFSPPEWSYRGRPNVVGVWRAGASGGRSLVLNGHVDVVSPEPVGQWSHDPWGAEIHGDRLYGRGACDMKSGVTAMVWALRAVQAAGVRLKGDVILHSVIEEECTGNGTLACLARGFGGDGCLIAEPHYRQALIAQVGVLWCRVKVRGVAGHVKGANRAINAIEKTYVLIRAMRELEDRLNREKHRAYADHPWPINFNPGVIRSGDWPSTVPAECELEFRMGFYPGTTIEAAKTLVRTHLLDAAARDPWLRDNPPDITFYGFHAEGSCEDFAESPVIQTLDAVHRELIGCGLTPESGSATTDTRFFHLYYGTPAVCFGPWGAGAHGTDEYVELHTVREVTRVIAAFVLDWCGIARP
ncbi:MAG TPA: ArgE/DapE family deacylase [bacterium]|nr:ArgE/DapE family deacylase [bacterium]